jgi:hypothetical protein
MWLVVAALAGATFGAGDQYLGSVASWPWSWQVAGLSAPWLVLPFLLGMAQRTPRRAMLVGATTAVTAVAAYCAMILSPMEGTHLTSPLTQIVDTTRSQWPWFLGALVVAPLYGLLGHRWRTRRTAWCVGVLVATVCLEPVARVLVGQLQPDRTVWLAEVACGLAAATAVVAASVRARLASTRT